MFASLGDMLETATLAELYQNSQYAVYLAGMDAAINRALYRLQSVLPKGRVELTSPAVTGSVATFNLGNISDFDGVSELREQTDTQYAAHAYRWEGGTTLVVPLYRPDRRYVLLYRRSVKPIEPMADDDYTLPIPDALAALIPYYVKAELYEEEDPTAARAALEYFDTSLSRYQYEGESDQPQFVCKYSWEEL